MNLDNIKSDGFRLQKFDGTISDFAYLSLETAIKSYASTYNAIADSEDDFKKITAASLPNDKKDKEYSHNYIKHYFQTIIHLHHFFELIIKGALRNEHALLATDANDKPAILFKLLKNEKIEDKDEYNLNSVTFSIALGRICTLIKEQLINRKYFFIAEHKKFLEILNHIRNRLLHRGTFVLRYQALDWLFIKYAIPLINEIISRKTFVLKMIPFDWKFQPISCGINGLAELSKCIKGSSYDVKRVAVIKEIIRAAYENPIRIPYNFDIHAPIRVDDISVPKGDAFNNEIISQRAINLANEIYNKRAEFSYGNMIYKISKCPVCGIDSLLIYEDYSNINKEPPEKYNCKVKCTCCTFEIKSELDNLAKMDLNLVNYWERDLTPTE